MQISRRKLIVLTAAAAASGCAAATEKPALPPLTRAPLDAGAASRFAAGVVNEEYCDSHSIFIVRSGKQLFAMSAICTHRHCKIETDADGFLCPCHGATFDRNGVVTRAPAKKDLPRLAVQLDARGHLIVRTDQPPLSPDLHQSPQGMVAIQ